MESGYEEEEDYSSMAGDVRQQSAEMDDGFVAPQRMAMPQQSAPQTMKWSAVGTADFGTPSKTKADQQPMSPKMQEAQFYMNLGDFSGAEALLKSKGAAIFQRDEPYEIETMDESGKRTSQTFMISPRGEYGGGVGPDGKPIKLPAWALATRAGIGSVPFRGGDQAAIQYRTLMAKVQKFSRDLNELESLYRNNMYLGTLDPSEAAARARMLESGIKTDYLAIMKDTKGMGGQVSDKDMEMAEYMTPNRASSALTRLGGNELAILRSVRDGALRKVMEVGSANGISFRQQSQSRTGLHPYFERGAIRRTSPDGE